MYYNKQNVKLRWEMERNIIEGNSIDRRGPVIGGEEGVAILQVMIAGTLVMLAAVATMQFMTHNDRNSMRLIRRNQNLNYSIDLATFVNNGTYVKRAASALSSNAALPIQYE